MLKKAFFAASLLLINLLNPIPPTLPWQSSCWNEMVFQLLRNIKPLSDKLISTKITNNPLAEDYAELLKLTNSASGVTVSTSQIQNFWQSSCKRINLNKMQSTEAIGFLEWLLNDLEAYSTSYLDITATVNGAYIKHHQTYSLHLDKKNDSFEKDLSTSSLKILHLSDFIIFYYGMTTPDLTFSIPLTLDMSPYLKDIQGANMTLKFVPQKTEPGEWMYELIGLGVWKPGHFYSYIKDQFEKDPQWYYCWGVGSSPKQISEQDIKKMCKTWNTGSYFDSVKKTYKSALKPEFLVYKRLPYTKTSAAKPIEDLARALSDFS